MTERWGGRPFDDLNRMLDVARPDVVYVCVPPHQSVAIGERLVERGIPFLTEKPLSADDADGPVRLAAAIDRAGLLVAVGYHLRALDIMPELRERLADRPPHLVVARWLAETPRPGWWGRVAQGGGQVVEQATHLYDLARHLVGEAEVVGAASVRTGRGDIASHDVAAAAAAVVRFRTGAVGSFASAHRLDAASIEIAFASERRSRPSPRDHTARATGASGSRTSTTPARSSQPQTRTRSRRLRSSTRSRHTTRPRSSRPMPMRS